MKYITNLIKNIPKELRYTLIFFVTTRFFLSIIGIVSYLLLKPFHSKLYVYSKYFWLDIWGTWDTGWYLNIAKNWYPPHAYLASQSNYGFFPFYPLLMKIIGFFIKDYFIAGMLISNVSLIISSVFLYRLIKIDYGDKIALGSIKYQFLFPVAFIFSGVFNESLFLMLVILSFYYAKKDKWFLAGFFGFFVSLTKPHGVFLFLPLVYEYLKTINFKPGNIKGNITFLFLIPLGLFVFALHTYYLTADPFAYIHTKIHGWHAGLSNPFENLIRALFFNNDINIIFPAYFTFTLLILLLIFFKEIKFSYWLFGMSLLLAPILFHKDITVIFPAMFRLCLPNFPVYIILSKLSKHYYVDLLFSIVLGLFQGFLMVFWVSGFKLVT